MFRQAEVVPGRPPSRLTGTVNHIHGWIRGLTQRRHFEGIVIAVVIIWALSLPVVDRSRPGRVQDHRGPEVNLRGPPVRSSLSRPWSPVVLVFIGAWAWSGGPRPRLPLLRPGPARLRSW